MAGPSATVASLVVKMGLDPSGMATGAAQAEAQMGRLQKFANSTLGKGLLQGVGLGGGLVATQAIATGVQKAIEFTSDAIVMASDLAETQTKLDAVFEGSADAVRAWAETTDAALITTQNELLASAATFGNFLQAMGTSEAEAVKYSTTLTALAADLASFNNLQGGAAEAAAALTSGMSGETEAARRLGIDLRVSRLEADLLAKGVRKTNGAFTSAQLVAARYEAIMKDTAKAQGDVARTSEGFANKSRALATRLAELQTGLGEFLLPGMLSVVTFLTDLLGLVQDLTDAIPKAVAEAQKMGKAVGDVVGRDLVNDFTNLVRIVGTGGAALATDAPNKIADAWGDIQAGRPIAENVDAVATAFQRIGAIEPPPPPDIAGPIGDEFDKAEAAVIAGIGSVKEALRGGAGAPQLISRDERLENLQTRFRASMKKLIAARKADDPFSERFWTGAVAKTARTIASLGGRAKPALAKTTKVIGDEGRKGKTAMEKHGRGIGKAVPDAVNAKVPAAGGAAKRMASAVQTPLASLPGQAVGWGMQTGSLFATGLASQVGAVSAAAGMLAAAAAGPIKTESPPKMGPLRDIEKWGPEIVTLWTNPMLKRTRDVEKVGERLGAALRPKMARDGSGREHGWDRLSRAAVGALADGGVRSRRENHFHIGTLIANPSGLDELDRRMGNRRRHRERGAGRRNNDPD